MSTFNSTLRLVYLFLAVFLFSNVGTKSLYSQSQSNDESPAIEEGKKYYEKIVQYFDFYSRIWGLGTEVLGTEKFKLLVVKKSTEIVNSQIQDLPEAELITAIDTIDLNEVIKLGIISSLNTEELKTNPKIVEFMQNHDIKPNLNELIELNEKNESAVSEFASKVLNSYGFNLENLFLSTTSDDENLNSEYKQKVTNASIEAIAKARDEILKRFKSKYFSVNENRVELGVIVEFLIIVNHIPMITAQLELNLVDAMASEISDAITGSTTTLPNPNDPQRLAKIEKIKNTVEEEMKPILDESRLTLSSILNESGWYDLYKATHEENAESVVTLLKTELLAKQNSPVKKQ